MYLVNILHEISKEKTIESVNIIAYEFLKINRLKPVRQEVQNEKKMSYESFYYFTQLFSLQKLQISPDCKNDDIVSRKFQRSLNDAGRITGGALC